MGSRLTLGCLAVAASLWTICPAGAFCQQNDQGQTQTRSKAPPATNSGNAFPLAQSEAAAKAAQSQNTDADKSAQNGANQSKPSPAKNPTAQANPFPEAQSKAAAKADDGSTQSPGAANTGASSSSGGYSSSDAHLPPAAVGQGDFKSHARMDTYTRDHTQDGRIENDLNAADLFMKNGNYRGAYLRYQDTLQYDSQNDTALYGIAAAMCKENRTAEAMAQFKSYAKNNPQGKYALKAEKMLAHPNRCMHNW